MSVERIPGQDWLEQRVREGSATYPKGSMIERSCGRDHLCPEDPLKANAGGAGRKSVTESARAARQCERGAGPGQLDGRTATINPRNKGNAGHDPRSDSESGSALAASDHRAGTMKDASHDLTMTVARLP